MQCREKRHVLICKWIGTLLRIKVGVFKTSVRRAHAHDLHRESLEGFLCGGIGVMIEFNSVETF